MTQASVGKYVQLAPVMKLAYNGVTETNIPGIMVVKPIRRPKAHQQWLEPWCKAL